MKTLSFKKDKIKTQAPTLSLVEVMDSKEPQKDFRWFKDIIKSFSISNDMSLETFDRIESKKTIHSMHNDLD